MTIADHPLHRSGRADVPHPALTLGHDAKSPQGIGMTHARRGQPAVNKPPHPVPGHAAVLTPPRERAMPEAAHLKPKDVQRVAVCGHAVMADVPTDDCTQPCAYDRDGVVHAPSEFGLHRIQLGLQSLATRLPPHRETSIALLLPADGREAEEVDRLRLPESALPPVVGRLGAEFQQPRLLGMPFQVTLPKPFGEFCPESVGIRLDLESQHGVIRIPDDDDVAGGVPLAPCLDPQVTHVVEIEVRQQRRCTAALRRSFFRSRSLPLLQHACVQPLLDETHYALVRDAVLDKLHEPSVVDGVEKRTDV